jgi:cytochrome c-type biogenesis protein CcmH/NrfG
MEDLHPKTKEQWLDEGDRYSDIDIQWYEEAIVAYSHALELDPCNPYIYTKRGFAYEYCRQYASGPYLRRASTVPASTRRL